MKPAEFIEEEFISEINTILSHSGSRYRKLRIRRISQGIEGNRGYDGILKLKNIIHIQAKRGYYHDDLRNGKIEEDRRKKGLHGEFYSFALHKRSNKYKQHNKLWDLHKRRHGCAIYIAPLFHTYDELDIFGNTYYRNPFHVLGYRLYQGHSETETQTVKTLFLDKTMAIMPHALVTSGLSHHYSYDGSKVMFHSDPLEVREGISRGSFWFSNKLESAYNQEMMERPLENIINREMDDYDSFIRFAKSIQGRTVNITDNTGDHMLKIACDYIYSRYSIITYGIYA